MAFGLWIAVTLAALASASASGKGLTDIVVAVNTSYACLRVPSAVRGPGSGAILVFLEARKGSCDDQAPKDIVMCRSDDEGASWSDPAVVVGDGRRGSNQTYRNPFAGFAQDGSLLLQFVNSTLSEPWVSLQVRSTDDGRTWGPIQRSGYPLQSLDGVLPGPGSALTLAHPAHAGRMVSCGATGYHAGHSMLAALWYSDDSGASWTLSKPTFPGMAECQAAELRDGTVMVTFRARHENRSCDCRAHSTSSDGGATWLPNVTWDPELVEPVCSAGLLSTPAGLFFSNPSSRVHRVNMTLKRSEDMGVTWPWQRVLWAGPSAYSTLVATRSGVGVVFERGVSSPYERISFALQPAGG